MPAQHSQAKTADAHQPTESRDTKACPEGLGGLPWEDSVERNHELAATCGNLANARMDFPDGGLPHANLCAIL